MVRKGRKNLLFWFDIDWIKEIIFSFAVWDKTAYVEMDATSDGHCRVLVDSWKLKNLNECVISTFAIVKEAKV